MRFRVVRVALGLEHTMGSLLPPQILPPKVPPEVRRAG